MRGTTDADGVIYVIRHGEKNRAGNHLNETGLSRADFIASLWDDDRARFQPPKAIFANFYNDEYNSMELVQPLADRLGLPVNSSFNRANNWEAAEAMLSALGEYGSPILVAWEHRHIVRLLVDMGCFRPWLAQWWSRAWPSSDFDEVFILTFRRGVCASVARRREGFTFQDTPAWQRRALASALVLAGAVAALVLRAWMSGRPPRSADTTCKSPGAGGMAGPPLLGGLDSPLLGA